jgi:hypothetical protein
MMNEHETIYPRTSRTVQSTLCDALAQLLGVNRGSIRYWGSRFGLSRKNMRGRHRTTHDGLDLRCPSAKARDEWFNSFDGVRCLDGTAEGQYLRNRLECAFLAGWEKLPLAFTDLPSQLPAFYQGGSRTFAALGFHPRPNGVLPLQLGLTMVID